MASLSFSDCSGPSLLQNFESLLLKTPWLEPHNTALYCFSNYFLVMRVSFLPEKTQRPPKQETWLQYTPRPIPSLYRWTIWNPERADTQRLNIIHYGPVALTPVFWFLPTALPSIPHHLPQHAISTKCTVSPHQLLRMKEFLNIWQNEEELSVPDSSRNLQQLNWALQTMAVWREKPLKFTGTRSCSYLNVA